MCGRFYLLTHQEALKERFDISRFDMQVEPRYNIAPESRTAAIVLEEDGSRVLKSMRWGRIPSWSKVPMTKYRTINVKAESITTNKIFSRAFASRRCLVPATGFFEWTGEKGRKTPYHISLGKDTLFAFAGVYEVWMSKDKETRIESVAFATTSANKTIEPIHTRMPVILHPGQETVWLDPIRSQEELLQLLQPYPDSGVEVYEVSTYVNRPTNQGPECIRPTGK